MNDISQNTPVSHTGFSLKNYINTLIDCKWIVLICLVFFSMIGVFVAFISQPVYKTSGLLQVEDGGGNLGYLDDLMSIGSSGNEVTASIEILKSGMVLGPVVENLQLDIVITPNYFPIIGKAFSYRYKGQDIASPIFGLNEYAWGGQELQLQKLIVSEQWYNKEFIISAIKSDSYEVKDIEGKRLFIGRVGENEKFISNNEIQIEIFVNKIKALERNHFVVRKIYKDQAIRQVRANLSVKEKTKKSGILQVSFEHSNPKLVKKVVDGVLNSFIDQNLIKNALKQEKSLEFLNNQLPKLKNKLEVSEQVFNDYRSKEGSFDLSTETEVLLSRLTEVDAEILSLQQEKEVIKLNFKENHPRLIALSKKILNLQKERNNLEVKTTNLPKVQQEILRLSRDVEVNTELYTKLLGISQELEVTKAGAVGNSRVIDNAAMPLLPIRPNKNLIVVGFILLGMILSQVIIFLLNALNKGVLENPESIESHGLQVYAIIPQTDVLKDSKSKTSIIAHDRPNDLCIEAIRSLRTILQVIMLGAKNKALMISGASPGIGKSFVALNLAVVLANAGKKVLIIDADMRRGRLHENAGVSNQVGFSQMITGKKTKILSTVVDNLKIIPRGPTPNNPSEILSMSNLETIIQKLSSNFDLIIFDTPPIHAVTDAAIIGKQIGTTLFVARESINDVNEVILGVRKLEQSGVVVNGIVYNGAKKVGSRYGYAYQYDYAAS